MEVSLHTRRILIIGGAGFFGTNLVKRLIPHAPKIITVLDSLSPQFRSDATHIRNLSSLVEFIQGDYCDRSVIAELVKNHDIIVNLAAQTSHPFSMQDPILDANINVIGHLQLLQLVRELHPTAQVIYPSSSTMIGRAQYEPIDEAHPEQPLDIYSAHKGIAEKYSYIYANAFDIPTTTIRFANLFGPFGKHDPAFGFMNYFIEEARSGRPLRVFGDGKQLRNVLYVSDACDIVIHVMGNSVFYGKTFFAVHPEHHTVTDIATAVADVFGTTVEFVQWPELRKKIDVQSVRIASRHLPTLTTWTPAFQLRRGLEDTKRIYGAS